MPLNRGLPFKLFNPLRLRIVRCVHPKVQKIEKKRLLGIAVNKVHRFIR